MRVSVSAKIFAATLACVGATRAWAQCGPPDEAMPAVRESLLVSTAWLAAHQRDSGLVILHVQHMRHAGPVEHIPGARLVDAMAFTVGDFDLAPAPVIDSLLEAAGVSNASRVVLYGDPWVTGFVFTALDYVGHTRAAILDGGLEQWRAEGRPVTAQFGAVQRAAFTPRAHSTVVVDAAWLTAHLRDRNVVLLDTRSPAEYAGTAQEMGLPRTGHIPGAWLVPWTATFTQPGQAQDGHASKLKSVAELRALLREAGVHSGDILVTYCTIGMRASQSYFVLRYLGYHPKFYDGSWDDWSRRSELPVATGTARGTP
jgi:thiosulfate/3-mercaptopyruvate sulfurtransferase